MAIQTFPKGVTKDQFIGALRYVMLREAARIEHGAQGMASLESFFGVGGTYEQMPESARKAIDDCINAGLQGSLPGMKNDVMNWAEFACFARYYAMLDIGAAAVVCSNMAKGFADPWNVETSDGRTILPSPLALCASGSSIKDMYCCPSEVRNDMFYSGSMPGEKHPLSIVEWLLIGAGAVAAASAVVWVGSDRGWFGKDR